MKYMYTIFDGFPSGGASITITNDDVSFSSFPAVAGNPNYDAFLTSAKLIDEEVHALESDVWYNFPTEEIT